MEKYKIDSMWVPVALEALFWYSLFQEASDILNICEDVKISVDGYDEAECIEKETWIRFQELVEVYKSYVRRDT